MAGSLLAETNIWRELKKANEIQAGLLAEQRVTNQWLAHIAGLLERQPQMMGAGPWPPVQR